MSTADLLTSILYAIWSFLRREPMAFTVLALIAAGMVTLWLSSIKRQPNEPTYIMPTIPVIGHLINLATHRMEYYVDLGKRYGLPIYTLPMPGGKIYVVRSPDVLAAIQKVPRTISFRFMEARFTVRLAGLGEAAAHALMSNVFGDDPAGGKSLFMDGVHATHDAIRGADSLGRMSVAMAASLEKAVASLSSEYCSEDNPGFSTKDFDLWSWIRHTVTLASTDAVYGHANPYQDKAVEEGFWAFNDDTMPLLANFFPSITAWRGYRGRDVVSAAFTRYFAAGHHETSSDLIRARYGAFGGHGLSLTDAGRFETITGIAMLANTVPTAFWTLFNAFAYPDALAAIRSEAERMIMNGNELSITHLRENPRLLSHLQESMRHAGAGGATRVVQEDITLDGRYALEKGTYLMVPSRAIHFAREIWGADVDEFRPDRFVSMEAFDRQGRKERKVPQNAFRGFGGGTTLCPGRFFASGEVISLVALMALKFDMEISTCEWQDVKPDGGNMTLSVAPPLGQVRVKIREREAWKGRSIRLVV